ncbi:putative uncharacterized protein [Prevotella sp. CAG:617]|nr:putative uncharacterized protein [Prevotella sp. CAG:617]
MDTDSLAVVVILHGYLALGVRTQVGHLLALPAYFGQYNQNVVGQRKWQRHVGIGFVIGITEHHALIAGSLRHGVLALHATVDVGALLMDGAENTATLGVELILGFGVTNAANGATYNILQVGIGF